MHKPERYLQRLEVVEGRLCCVVTACWKGESLDVYRKFEDGEAQSRNLYLGCMTGYIVSFPGTMEYALPRCPYMGKYKATLEPWGDGAFVKNFPWRAYPLVASLEEQELVTNLYPDFKYTLKKCALSTRQIVDILPIWKKHKDVEFLLAAGWYSLALNKSLHRLKVEKKREVCRFIAKCELSKQEKESIKLRDVLNMMKAKIPPEKADLYMRLKWFFSGEKIALNLPLLRYIERQTERLGQNAPGDYVSSDGVLNLYRDYLNLAQRAGHDTADQYWRFPKDLRAAHDKVLLEVNRIQEMEWLARLEEDRRAQAAKIGRYKRALSRCTLPHGKFLGYEVFVSFDADEWVEQAEALHQCIVSADYMQHVIEKKCVIVFLREKGKPAATAEILRGKKIGQFYTDEHLEDYSPNEKMRKALDKWLKKASGGIFDKKAAA